MRVSLFLERLMEVLAWIAHRKCQNDIFLPSEGSTVEASALSTNGTQVIKQSEHVSGAVKRAEQDSLFLGSRKKSGQP